MGTLGGGGEEVPGSGGRSVTGLLDELKGMKVRALKKRAREVDVEEEKIDEADDADDVKATLISLIMGNVGVASPPRSGSSHHDTWDELLGNMTREYDDIVPTSPPQVRSSRPYHRDMGTYDDGSRVGEHPDYPDGAASISPHARGLEASPSTFRSRPQVRPRAILVCTLRVCYSLHPVGVGTCTARTSSPAGASTTTWSVRF